MIESQFCSMSDEKDFGYEETKSTILDYFMFFKQTKFAVSCIAVGSAIVFFLFFQILVNVAAVFVDLGHFYTIPPSPFAFVHPLDAVFMWTIIGFVITPGVIVPMYWLFWKTIVKGRKIEKQGKGFMKKTYSYEDTLCQTVGIKKNKNISKAVCQLMMFNNIPDVSLVTAKRILNHFETIAECIDVLLGVNEDARLEFLRNIPASEGKKFRKLSKKSCQNILDFLLD